MFIINTSNIFSSKNFLLHINPFKDSLSLKERCSACALLILIGASVAFICKSLHYVWKKYFKIEIRKTQSQINPSAGVKVTTPFINKTQSPKKAPMKDIPEDKLHLQSAGARDLQSIIRSMVDSSTSLNSIVKDKEAHHLRKSTLFDDDPTRDISTLKNLSAGIKVTTPSIKTQSPKQAPMNTPKPLTELLFQAIDKKDETEIDNLCLRIKQSGEKLSLSLGIDCVKKYMNSLPKYENIHILFMNQPALFNDPNLICQILKIAIDHKDHQLTDRINDKIRLDNLSFKKDNLKLLLEIDDLQNIKTIFRKYSYEITCLLADAVVQKEQILIDKMVGFFQYLNISLSVLAGSDPIEKMISAKDYKNLKILFSIDSNKRFFREISPIVKDAIEKNDHQWIMTLSDSRINSVFEEFLKANDDLPLHYIFNNFCSRLNSKNIESLIIYVLNTDVPVKLNDIIIYLTSPSGRKITLPSSLVDTLMSASKYDDLYMLIGHQRLTCFNSKQINILLLQAIHEREKDPFNQSISYQYSVIRHLIELILHSKGHLKIDLNCVDSSNRNCIDALFELDQTLSPSNELLFVFLDIVKHHLAPLTSSQKRRLGLLSTC